MYYLIFNCWDISLLIWEKIVLKLYFKEFIKVSFEIKFLKYKVKIIKALSEYIYDR